MIPGLAHGQTYDFRGRIEGVPTAGRAERPRGDWTYLLNQTIDALADETSPPRLPGEGQNLMEGGKFELKQHRLNNFSLMDSRADGDAGRLSNANMTVDFQNTRRLLRAVVPAGARGGQLRAGRRHVAHRL